MNDKKVELESWCIYVKHKDGTLNLYGEAYKTDKDALLDAKWVAGEKFGNSRESIIVCKKEEKEVARFACVNKSVRRKRIESFKKKYGKSAEAAIKGAEAK